MERRLPAVMGAVLLALLLIYSILTLSTARPAQAAPRQSASASGCVADWYVSYSGTGSWTLINTDPDDLPLSALYFSRSYNDPTDFSHGYLDFNRDGKSDVFSAVPILGGYYQWRYSSGGASPWIDLAYDSTPPDQLRFGDFNGDGYTDVFSTVALGNGLYQWQYSPGGAGSYVNLAYDSTPPDQLRFGDFNGDGRTDVFALKDLGTGELGWNVSYSGTQSYTQTNSATTPLSEMQFGDVNGDGHTDVFTTISNTTFGEWEWFYSSAGTGAYQSMLLTNLGVHDVQLVGDFNGDHRSDFFYTYKRPDGLYQWAYYYFPAGGGVGSTQLAYADTPPDQLRFADFNGDGVTDVFKRVQRCSQYLPIMKK